MGLRHHKDPKVLIECLNNMQDAQKNIDDFNPGKECKVLIVFDDMVADMISHKMLHPIVSLNDLLG